MVSVGAAQQWAIVAMLLVGTLWVWLEQLRFTPVHAMKAVGLNKCFEVITNIWLFTTIRCQPMGGIVVVPLALSYSICHLSSIRVHNQFATQIISKVTHSASAARAQLYK